MRNPPLILVVDDTPADALLLSRSLAKAGFEVAIAHGGDEAVMVAAARCPDLILLDMTMPRKDGISTCHSLKEHSITAQVPVIFVTAHTSTDHIVKAFAAGGCDYVTKPVRMNEILARVTVHLRLREAEEKLVERNSQLESLSRQLYESNEMLERLSRVDALTELLNRRAWGEAAEVEHDRAIRYKREYGILMLDVDYFKLLNDTYGHRAGDEGLRTIGRAIGSVCRSADIAGRYGGEEFIVLVPETNIAGVARLAERIRHMIWSLNIKHSASPAGRVTISIGFAQSDGGSLDSIVHQADTALYAAKKAGRNRVHGPPIVNPDPVDKKVSDASPNALTTANRLIHERATVLIAEDDPGTRMVCRGSLGRNDYSIIEVADGQSAIASAIDQAPDVIIMDVVMPGMGGLESIRTLKADQRTRDIPIIIISARDSPTDVVTGLEAGADEYLTKPIQSTALATRVRSMVRWSRQRRDLLQSNGLRAEQVRVLSALVDACRAIGIAETVEVVLEHACATVAEVTGSARVSAMLPDADGLYLTIIRSIGLDDATIGKVRVPKGHGIAGRVFESGKPVIVNAEADLVRSRPVYDSDYFASVPFVSAPFESGSEILGVLNVTEHSGGRPFGDSELEYISLVASIAGSSLQMLLHRKSRDDARDLIVVALARLAEHRDNETARHVERVTLYSRILAEALRQLEGYRDRIDDRYVLNLARAVPLHDIGKVAIPDSILRKPGRLTIREMQIMRTHADIGAETIRSVVKKVPGMDFLNMAVDVIQSHHEWFDGSGYPHGLAGEAIPLSARIVSVADVYDAMTTDRVYRQAVCHEDAVQSIQALSGTQFDPMVVRVFMEHQDEFKKLGAELTDRIELQREPLQGATIEGPLKECRVDA